MKRICVALSALSLCFLAKAVEQQTVGSYTWYYNLNEYYDDTLQTQVKRAEIVSQNGCAVFPKPDGALTIPATLGGYAVTSIGYGAFSGCSGLTAVTIPSSVITIRNHAFGNCAALSSVTLSAGLKTLGYEAFYNCDSLTSVVIPDTVQTIDSYCFRSCQSLATVKLGSGVKTIDCGAFRECLNLTTINLPNALETIGSSAFYDCDNLKTLTIPASVTSIGEAAFRSCAQLAFTVASGNANYSALNGSLYNKDRTLLIRGSGAVTECSVPVGVKQIGDYAFDGCTTLKTIMLPASVVSIGKYAFQQCTSLTGIDIPAKVKTIEEYTFNSCTSLASVTIPSGVTSIGDWAFYNCDALTTVDIPSTVVSIGQYAFGFCDGLTEIVIPEGVKTIGYYAFHYCNKVKRITIPASVTSIGNDAFCYVYPDKVILYGKVWPNGVSCEANEVYVTEANGAYWQKEKGEGVNYFREDDVTVSVLSATPLKTDAAKLEVKYRVTSKDATANVRALAFVDGTESFANVVRPETFTEGSQIGDGVTANAVQSFVWDVKGDWTVDLAKVKVKVYAMRPGSALVPLELITIPAVSTNRAMQVSWNAIGDEDLLAALYWLYADKTPGLSVENGILKNDATELVNGNALIRGNRSGYDESGNWRQWYFNPAPAYVFGKMGYQVLTDALLPYVREMTEKELKTTSPVRSYAFKYLD